MPLPGLSPAQRQQALEKAAEMRQRRAELRAQLKSGKLTLADVLNKADDEVIGKMKVSTILENLPGIGKVRARKIMEKLDISASRRVRGLGSKQKDALLAEFGPSPAGRRLWPRRGKRSEADRASPPEGRLTRLDSAAVAKLVPQGDPPAELIGDLEDELLTEPWAHDAVLRRSLLWQVALQTAFEESGLWKDIPGYDSATYGFTTPDLGYAFGVIVHAKPGTKGPSGPLPNGLVVGGRRFPIVVRRPARPDSLHYRSYPKEYPKEHPSNGTTACLAEIPGRGVGLLTAAHLVADLRVPARVNLTSGQLFSRTGQGILLAVGPPRVDAAVISSSQEIGAVGKPISIRKWVAPGTPTQMLGQASGLVRSIVRHSGPPRISVEKTYKSVEFLVFLDNAARPGDSGALVTAVDGTDQAIALYLGDAPDENERDILGRCQLLRQVELSLGLKLYYWPE